MKKLIYLIKAIAYSLIIAIFLLLVVTKINASEISPEWMTQNVEPNSYLLSCTSTPNFVSPDIVTRLLGNKIQSLNQDYSDQTRNYELKRTYSTNTTVDEATYESNMQGFAHQVIGAARNNQTKEYTENIKSSEDNGAISPPLVYVGAIGAFGMGTPVKTEMLGSKIEWNGDLMRQHGQLSVKNSFASTRLEVDQSNNPEHYRATLDKILPLNFNSSVVYGSTSGSVHAILSRPLGFHLSASVDATRPLGSTTNTVAGETVGLSYGVGF